jgi:tetratricopeptide (TPR) repeat protein
VSEDSQALIAACGLGARAYFAAGDREGAAAVLDAWAGAEGADTAEVNLWQGLLHMTREQWQDAAEVLRDLPGKLTTRPLRMLSFELAAEACVHVGDLAAASFFLSEALSRSPAPDVRWRLIRQAALIQLAHGGAAEAERLLALLQEGVNAMAQADLELYGVLGLVGGGQAGPALDRFRPASAPPAGQASPALVWVTGNELAKALTAREEWSLAAEVWRQIAATAPSRGAGRDAALRAVDCLRAAGKTADAAAELEKVRAAYPDVADEPAMLVQLAALRTDLGRGEDAFALLERVRAQEDAPAVLRYRAACAMGLQARAEEDYGRAVDLLLSAEELSATPEDRALVLMLAADSCASLGDHVRAAKIYERAASAAGTQSVQERAIYNLAVSRTGARLYSAAVDAYTTYLERWPQAVNAGAVRFERGVALRLAGESGRAVSELTALADLLEDPAVAARALLEASAAASDAGDSAVAVQLLARLLHDYPDSALRAQALYQRARISFFQGRHQEAVNDCRRFLEEMPEHPLAADVLMWLGAHFARVERDLDSSEAYYLQLAGQHGNAPEAPLALYQAARNAYERGRFTDTEGHVVRLFSEFPDAPGRIRALAALLLGDVLAAGGEYAAAAPYFRSAAAAADSEAGVAAASWGRLGDMYYSMAQGDPEQLDEAISCYERVLGDPLAPRDLREMARYRLAKALEKRDRIERAIQEYGELVWGYAEDRGSAGIEDWYYFARSVYDVTNLLVLERRFHEAVRAYERLARADTPFSEDAGEPTTCSSNSELTF